jgi:DNA invertase Pin-like site-specific DNA recombinase
MSKRVCIYVRVSTTKQTVENQIQVLKEYSDRCGYQITQIYSDNGISGSKGRQDRPGLDQMMKDGVQRKFEMVLVWSVDRLGRSVSDLVQIMKEFNELKIDLYFNQQSIDTSTSSGRMVFGIFGCISEMERNLISERVTVGLQRAVSQGKKLGRPTKMNDGMKNAVKLLREKGMGIKQISKQLQIGIGTVYSVL